NSADALAVAFACWANGWVYLPLNAHENAERQAFIVSHAASRVLVHTPALAGAAAAVGTATGVPTVAGADLPDDLPADRDQSYVTGDCGWQTPGLRVYTSGTTGAPKGFVLTTGNLLADGDALCRVTGWHADTRVLVVLPIHHVNGLVVSCLQAWYAGASVVL